MPRTRVVSADKYTFVYAAPIRSRPTPHAGAGRHLLQVGQAVEDTLWHTRQLVIVQSNVPVGRPDMSRRIHPVAFRRDRISHVVWYKNIDYFAEHAQAYRSIYQAYIATRHAVCSWSCYHTDQCVHEQIWLDKYNLSLFTFPRCVPCSETLQCASIEMVHSLLFLLYAIHTRITFAVKSTHPVSLLHLESIFMNSCSCSLHLQGCTFLNGHRYTKNFCSLCIHNLSISL